MKILHLYPADNAMMARYVALIVQGLPAGAVARAVDNAREAQAACGDGRPDIVHLHGCCHADLMGVAARICRQGGRLVISPHGDLQPWTSGGSRLSAQLMGHAYALIAQSPAEAENLRRQRCERIELIQNPIITRQTTARELSLKTYAVYQKVLASDVLALMDDEARTTLRLLLKAAITGDRRWLADEEPGSPDWQKLYVYARYEGVLSLLQQGLSVVGIAAPPPTSLPIYLPNGYQMPSAADGQGITGLVRTAHAETLDGSLSLLRLVELDKALRNEKTDEEVLLQELKAAHLTPFLASLLQVLAEQTGLDEGFMPLPPVDNAMTRRIRTTITKHLKI